MGEDRLNAEQEPKMALRQVAATRNGVMEDWHVHWEVENRGTKPLKILAARLPHGQFKSQDIRFEPPLDLPPGGSERFQTSVRCNEPSGMVTENAFVILHVVFSGEALRIFARIRVIVDSAGKPSATTESITTQKIGFSDVRA